MIDQLTYTVTYFIDSLRLWLGDNIHTSKWFGAHLVNILTIILVTWLIRKFGARFTMRFISSTVRHDMYRNETDRKKRVKTLQGLITAVFNAGTWIIAGLLIVSEVRPSYSGTIFASAGIIGVALGIGAQGLIKDLVNGMFVIIENQYRVGDIVELEKIYGGEAVKGTVEAITMRTTTLRGDDGSVCHVPNGSITVTMNKTMDYGRLQETVVVSGETDLDEFEKLVNKVGNDLASSTEHIDKISEAPRFDKVIGLDDKGDFIIRITAKTAPSEQWKVRSELFRRLKKAAIKDKISLHS